MVYRPRRVELKYGRDVFLGVKLAPALVEGHPHSDAGAVIELRNHLAQLLRELRAAALVLPAEGAVFAVLHMPARQQRRGDHRGIIAPAAVRHVLPHQHAQAVAVVVPAQRLHLDVFPEHVETHGLCGLDVEAERLIARRGVQSIGPPALVEQSVVEIWLSVQAQALHALGVGLHRETPHGEIALHPVLAQRQAELIEIGVLRRPEMHLIPQPEQCRRPGVKVIGHAVYERTAGALAVHEELHRALVHMRRYIQRADVLLRHALAPHRLPDAAHGRIPDAAGLELLLAAGVIALVRVVRHAHDELVGLALGIQQLRDVSGKAEETAAVRAGLTAVHPDMRRLVHRAEMEQHASDVEALGQHKVPAVPEVLPRLERPAHSRELGFRRKGHDYLPVILLRLVAPASYGVFPGAVEVEVALAPELRARVFGQRVFAVKGLTPLSCQHGLPSF